MSKTTRAKDRPKRTPIGSRNVLTTDQRSGFVRRWVNDEPGRVQMFEEAGYTTVNKPTQVGDERAGNASNVGGSVTRKSVGGGQNAVLMEIPDDYYKEDQAAKEQHIRKLETSLLPEELKGDTYGEGISISSSNPRQPNSPKVVIQ